MNRRICYFSCILIAVAALWGCSKEMASEQEVLQMCAHLAELRNHPDDQQMVTECIAESARDEVTKKQAQCRIYAVNKEEYWIRCRTGEPRPAPPPRR